MRLSDSTFNPKKMPQSPGQIEVIDHDPMFFGILC